MRIAAQQSRSERTSLAVLQILLESSLTQDEYSNERANILK